MISTQQKIWKADIGWADVGTSTLVGNARWVLVFGGRAILEDSLRFTEIQNMYPQADIVMCSSAGEIVDTQIHDYTLSLTAVSFEKTNLSFATTTISKYEDSENAGRLLASKLPHDGLVHVMVFSDGLLVNGTGLVTGLNAGLPNSVAVTGGLVGDGPDFKKTLVGLNEVATSGNIVAIGFYGADIRVGYGSLGGWDTFGIERTITKAKNNILYELDDQPALTLYKKYLGEQAEALPSSGLLFPLKLHISTDGKDVEVVRTILGVNEEDQSMIFAGDMPIGATASLMKANFERLIDGASDAGSMSVEALGTKPAELAILVSCIGRKLVLQERLEEETEAVRAAIGATAAMTGFYSYGELCPVASTEKVCELHNQTMTITTFREE